MSDNRTEVINALFRALLRSDITDVQIMFKANGRTYWMEQSYFPFDLKTELKVLLEDSISINELTNNNAV